MGERPYTVISCAVSVDGYLDDCGPRRLVLSGPEDLEQVDALRDSCDAILVGAGTVRADDPRLLVRSPTRHAARRARGLAPSPTRVTVTRRGRFGATRALFAPVPDVATLVYCPDGVRDDVRGHVGAHPTVIGLGGVVEMAALADDLYRRGTRRLMVEGGGSVITQFLAADLADELRLAVAPVFVGDDRAPRLVGPGRFPWQDGRRAVPTQVRRLGDVVVTSYALSDRCTGD